MKKYIKPETDLQPLSSEFALMIKESGEMGTDEMETNKTTFDEGEISIINESSNLWDE